MSKSKVSKVSKSREKILFISHATKDKKLITSFVEMLYSIGLKKENIFCSSIPELGVPIKEDIYDYLRNILDLESIVPVFMLSDNYYESAACLNEMGAVWIKQKDYFTFLLPGFEFKHIKGAVNPNKSAIKLDNSESFCEELTRFKDSICSIFNTHIDNTKWERELKIFSEAVRNFCPDIFFDISDCEGICIDEHYHDGCQVKFNNTTNITSINVSFTETNSEVCSAVFYAGGIDVRQQFKTDKTLKLRLRALGDIKKIVVELSLNIKNPQNTISVTNEWQEYCIPLKSYKAKITEWQYLKNINLLVYRRFGTKCSIEISDIKIE